MTSDRPGSSLPPANARAPAASAGRWGDLGARVMSGLVLAGVGVLAVWLGGEVFVAAAALAFAVMAWELAALSDAPGQVALRLGIGALAGVGVLVAQAGGWAMLALGLAPLAMAATPRREKPLMVAYALAMLIASVGIVDLDRRGAVIVVWLVLIVVVSDVMGYFAGRLIGGPLFWPAISPKKTWSGTIAGWLGAAALGAGFAVWQGHGWGLVYISPLVAMAGQAGDIVESLIKRRAGVKDASRLIPGHGGLLDRFDALIGATLAVQLLQMLLPLPLGLAT
ncbi:phosphatidate cytidylyltransferase [bacterium]|nr:phosphatidate cytidylyltransferase [bacterium]